jgi:hypothetical protein
MTVLKDRGGETNYTKLKIVAKEAEGGSRYHEIQVNGTPLLLLGGDSSPIITMKGGLIHVQCTIVGYIDDG